MTMKTLYFLNNRLIQLLLVIALAFFITGCDDDDDDNITPGPVLTGNEVRYPLSAIGGSGIEGTVTFSETDNNSTLVVINLTGTPDGGTHPAHIHFNTAVEGGSIAVSLNPVDGSTGSSTTEFTAQDDGTPVDFSQLVDFDGHVNVHLSESDLSTIVAQGDIGQNALTDESKTYSLDERAVEGISGTATFVRRANDETLVTIQLQNTPDGGTHPAHIHDNSAVEGGGIAISLTPVDGTTGISQTNITEKDDGTAITYSELLNYDGYINVHLSEDDLATIVAQGDVGGNELTGESTSYDLNERAVPGISGTATFEERVNGNTLVSIALENTPADGVHPAHIHFNTAAEGGGIAVSLTSVDGNTGMSMTNVESLDDGNNITYSELLDYDGYINVHLSADDLGTIVAQGDIGQNALTGESETYDLNERAVPGISGTATFAERINGNTLVTIMLDNTPADGVHPAHIHFNTAAEGGGIAISLTSVDGNTGMSMSSIEELDDETPITYAELLDYDGYINVHLSADDLGTIVAQGDIGQNALTGESETYDLNERAVPGISGTATFAERKNGNTLVSIALQNTPADGVHPAHIHFNTAAEGGGIAISLTSVDGNTGMSMTNVEALDDATPITYTELIDYNGYINVHLSAEDLGTIVAQGDIGQNALTGESISYTLAEKDVAGISGTATFEERKNGNTLITLMLQNTPADGVHPAHIHTNSAEEGGGIVVTLTSVDGNTGMSMTSVSQYDDETPVTYADLLDYDGHINVHLSADDLATIVAQGDIGANVQ